MTTFKASSQVSNLPLNLILTEVEGVGGKGYRPIEPVPEYTMLCFGAIVANTDKIANTSFLTHAYRIHELLFSGVGVSLATSDIIFTATAITGEAFIYHYNTFDGSTNINFPFIVPPQAVIKVRSEYAIASFCIVVSPCILDVIKV